jgi:hypothetical protein
VAWAKPGFLVTEPAFAPITVFEPAFVNVGVTVEAAIELERAKPLVAGDLGLVTARTRRRFVFTLERVDGLEVSSDTHRTRQTEPANAVMASLTLGAKIRFVHRGVTADAGAPS